MTTRHSHWRHDLMPTPPVRETTNRVLEMIEEGLLDPKQVVLMCLKWMSEDDVKEMCKANEIDLEEIEIDAEYHDYSEDELRKMGCFDNLNDDDYPFMKESEDI